jgi:hypothetical protein
MMFQVGDEVVAIKGYQPDAFQVLVHGEKACSAPRSGVVVKYWHSGGYDRMHLSGAENPVWGYDPLAYRKVQKRNSSLGIESFLTIKPGQFEEPKKPVNQPGKVKA